MFRRIQSHIADQLPAVGEARYIAVGQRVRQAVMGQSREAAQQTRHRIVLRCLLCRLVQLADSAIQIVQQLQIVLTATRRPALQRQLLQQLTSRPGPQLRFAPHPLIQREMLQLSLHLGSHPYQLMEMQQQLPYIALVTVGTHSCGNEQVQQQMQL